MSALQGLLRPSLRATRRDWGVSGVCLRVWQRALAGRFERGHMGFRIPFVSKVFAMGPSTGPHLLYRDLKWGSLLLMWLSAIVWARRIYTLGDSPSLPLGGAMPNRRFASCIGFSSI